MSISYCKYVHLPTGAADRDVRHCSCIVWSATVDGSLIPPIFFRYLNYWVSLLYYQYSPITILSAYLCSSGSHQLVKPWHNLSFGSRAFRISAPHIWNSLPTNVREGQSVLTFRRRLKTHYFQSAFSTP